MFKKLVSSLPYSPSLLPQVSFYVRRLQQENLTRQLGVIFAGMAVLVQAAFVVATPVPSIASDSNDLLRGGLRNERGQELSETEAKQTLRANLYSQEAVPGLRELFEFFGVDEADITASTKTTFCSSSEEARSSGCNGVNVRDFKIVGRERSHHNPESDIEFQTPLHPETYYYRPLVALEDEETDVRHTVLSIDNGRIYVLYAGGQIVFRDLPQAAMSNVAVATPPYQHVYRSKSARVVTGYTPVSVDAQDPRSTQAHQTTVSADEIIEYRLLIENRSNIEYASYAIPSDYMKDVLEYADIIDSTGQRVTDSSHSDQPIQLLDGGVLEDGVITWPDEQRLLPLGRIEKTVYVQIKNPIPATNQVASNSQRYDCKIINNYGTTVTISIDCPLEKRVELSINALPPASLTRTMPIVLALSGLGFFFYKRNQLLTTELNLIKKEYTGEYV